jgi:hypothetical protein
MPSTTKKQAHFMSAVAHGWQPPGRHVDVGVAKEFHNADKEEGKWEHGSKKHPSQASVTPKVGEHFNRHRFKRK